MYKMEIMARNGSPEVDRDQSKKIMGSYEEELGFYATNSDNQ